MIFTLMIVLMVVLICGSGVTYWGQGGYYRGYTVAAIVLIVLTVLWLLGVGPGSGAAGVPHHG